MPQPAMRPTRTVNGETREWNGSTWEPISSGGGPPSLPMIDLPHGPPGSSGRTDVQDLELLKQFLTIGGTVAGGLMAGPPGAIVGGAAGRMFGHVPEALTASATGQPSDSSFGGDAALGAMEGGAQELVPAVARPFLKGAGRVLTGIGRFGGDNAAWNPMTRAAAAATRGFATTGMPTAIRTAATAGPVLATTGGSVLDRAGEALGSGTLSTRLRGALGALEERLTPGLSHADRMAAGAEKYAGERTAQALQERAANRASGITSLRETPPPLDIRNGTPFEAEFPMGRDVAANRAAGQGTMIEPRPATDVYGDPQGLAEQTAQYNADVAAGFEPNQASLMNFGQGRPGGSTLPTARSWNPGTGKQPFAGVQLSDSALDALTKKVGGWGGRGPTAAVQTPSAAAASPRAVFRGWQEGMADFPAHALYNVEGGPLHGTTLTRGSLAAHGLDEPFTPPMPEGMISGTFPEPTPWSATARTKTPPPTNFSADLLRKIIREGK